MQRNGYDFRDIFEHSIYYVALKMSMENTGSRRFDVGKNMEMNIDKYSKQEEIIRQKNIELIESRLMSTIDVNDKDYAFLNLEKDDGTLRKLFKLNAKAILKL